MIHGRSPDYRVDRETGCWIWLGSRDRKGYGRKWLSHDKRVQAHRWFYEQHQGSIPSGLQLDHLCRNPSCVNPAHLEPVTSRQNTLRGYGPTAENARKQQCIHGHALSGENLYVKPDGKRQCRACRRITDKARYDRQKAEEAA